MRASDEADIGDYLEFGVSRGSSLACMYRALRDEEVVRNIRLFGFDSFEGLPPEAAAEGWQPSKFASTLPATRRYLTRKGVDLRQVNLVKGWFKDTLTPQTREQLDLGTASLIMIDCDIYSASRAALWFCEPLITNRAVVFLDDWGAKRALRAGLGERQAFREFLAAFPALSARPLQSYAPRARVFLLARAPDRP